MSDLKLFTLASNRIGELSVSSMALEKAAAGAERPAVVC